MGCGSLVAAGPRYVAPGEEASTAAVKLELAAAPDEPHTAPQPARDFRFEASAAALAWVHGPPPAAGCAANVVPPEAVRTHASAPSRPARGTSGGGDCPGSTRFEQPDGRPAPSDRDDLDYGPCFGPLTLDARTLERCSVPPESYELLSALDETNNSTVFLAEWKASRERVAVKRVRKRGSGQPFRTHANEVRVLSRLDHPCLARLIGIVDTPPQLDIVLEYCAGGDLHSYVRGGAGQGWDFLDLLCDVARGLAHMHEEWFAHLDVKPGNILLAPASGTAATARPCRGRLCDFGTATRLSASRGLCGVVGTPGFRAPEVEQGVGFDATLADVWSLGKVLEFIEFRTGRRWPSARPVMTAGEPAARPSARGCMRLLQGAREGGGGASA